MLQSAQPYQIELCSSFDFLSLSVLTLVLYSYVVTRYLITRLRR